MLVLSRKLNEKIVIDGNIVISLVKIDRNQVRIGIEAPGHVSILREELSGVDHECRRFAVAEAALACEA